MNQDHHTLTEDVSPAPKVALTIAGSDSGGGAGIAADLRTFGALGVFGTLVVTAVTAQNTVGVREFLTMTPEMVAAQLDAVVSDFDVRAAKTGMLATSGIVKLLANRAAAGKLPPLVIDPVLVSASGKPMFPGDDVAGAYRALFAHATVVTPNLPEAALLTGRELGDLGAMETAARELQALGPRLVVVKGGRRPGTEAVDVAFDGRCVTMLRAPWIDTANVHGTGCTFSAAITANLALGLEPLEAAFEAKHFVTRAILGGSRWHLGAGHGPLDQFGAAAARTRTG
ncbi:MAG: bifunctional hydroxymethylpyrimidine kinase/phosphomethylpyrimidine kinase [Acidimicrobiales bacterium]